jgi:hypothetical protein
MGFITKAIIAVCIIFAFIWVYNNYEVDTMDVCIGNEEIMMPITCQLQNDCVMYLTSAYTVGYPRTDMFTNLLTDVASCKDGHCYRKAFDFKDNRLLTKQCTINETTLSYKVTLKDMAAIRGWFE